MGEREQIQRASLIRASKMYLLNDFRFRGDYSERIWVAAVLSAWSRQDKIVLAVESEATSWLCLMIAEELYPEAP